MKNHPYVSMGKHLDEGCDVPELRVSVFVSPGDGGDSAHLWLTMDEARSLAAHLKAVVDDAPVDSNVTVEFRKPV